MHTVWTLPEGDANFSHRWQAIKMAFSKAIDPGEARSVNRQTRGERGIWQRRFWEHTIRDDRLRGASRLCAFQPGQTTASPPPPPPGRIPASTAPSFKASIPLRGRLKI